MRIYIILSLFSVYSYGQENKLSRTEIETKVLYIINHAIVTDSLSHKDSTCYLIKNGNPYSGYVLHDLNDEFRYHLYEEGKYYGEEWIFQTSSEPHVLDSLLDRLIEFRIRTDKNPNLTIVTKYYDFRSQKIHKIYLNDRYACPKLKPDDSEDFDVIIGGDNPRPKHDYKSFYPSGQKKEIFKRKQKGFESIVYHENGKVAGIYKIGKTDATGTIKEFDENGKCAMRMISRNGKLRGVYSIYKGEKKLSFLIRMENRRYRH